MGVRSKRPQQLHVSGGSMPNPDGSIAALTPGAPMRMLAALSAWASRCHEYRWSSRCSLTEKGVHRDDVPQAWCPPAPPSSTLDGIVLLLRRSGGGPDGRAS